MLLSKPMRIHDDTNHNFKLMALPDHARKIIIMNMGAVQMYLISRCSSKMKNQLKKYISHIQFSLQIEIDESIFFIIRANGVDLGSFEVKSLDPGADRKRFAFGNPDKLTTFWIDVFRGASRVYKKLLDRFSFQVRVCSACTEEDCIDIRRVIEWTETLKPRLTSNFKDEVFNPFKLMKLPYLALEQVIKNMSLMEAFNLAHCSSTLRSFVKYIFKKQKVKFHVQITSYIQFRLESSNGYSVLFHVCENPEDPEFLDECRKVKVGSKIPFYYSELEPEALLTFWKNIVEGASELYLEILDLFNIHFEKLVVIKEKIKYDYGSVVEWINRINRPIEEGCFSGDTVDDALYSQTIQSENFHSCFMYQKPSEYFKMPEFRFTAAHVVWQVFNAQWITRENLSEIGSAILNLKDLNFTDQEVNSILKDLIAGKFQNLEMITLGLNRRDFDPYEMLDGINLGEANWDVRKFERYGYNLTVEGTTDVQMDTGETCSFRFYTVDDEEGARSGVNVFIWK